MLLLSKQFIDTKSSVTNSFQYYSSTYLSTDMKLSWKVIALMLFLFHSTNHFCLAQEEDDAGDDEEQEQPTIPKRQQNCRGIFLMYNFISRAREFPRVKNVTAQSWAFKSTITLVNMGTNMLQAWKVYVGFQYKELLVSADGGTLVNGVDFPADVGNGTYISGSTINDLETAIDTANDFKKIQVKVELKGTQFGLKPSKTPMPKTIKLANDGYKCPAPTRKKSSMYVCCVKDSKFKAKKIKTKFLPRQKGDLLISYDVNQAYSNNYLAEITMENTNSLGRLDHWNLTWEWTRGEFIYSLKGAYVREVDTSDCMEGKAGQAYAEMDFSKVLNCQKKPIIFDLPLEKANDTEMGKIPFCCRNGSILPTIMDSTKSKSAFHMQVFKLPPDSTNKTSINPPKKWKIVGDLNPDYKCGAPIRVDPKRSPDPTGLQAVKIAIASWQIVCNISRPTEGNFRCCVTFSAYYNQSVIPCDTCACGCEDTSKCNPKKPAMLLPPEALLIPFENRSKKAKAWARIHHFAVPKRLPCSDNCGVTINWHVASDHTQGWTGRITLFNWKKINFENWFTALQFKKAGSGYQKMFSFNGTLLKKLNNTIFVQGIEGLTYLMGITNGSNPKKDPDVPGKQQSLVTFKKKKTLNIVKGDGFPTRVLFNGEECALPTRFPARGNRFGVNLLLLFLCKFVSFLLIERLN